MGCADRRKLGFVKQKQQSILVNVEQMLVGGDQQRDFSHGGFGEDEGVVEFLGGKTCINLEKALELQKNA